MSLIQLIFSPGNAVKLIGQVQILLLIPLISLKSHFGSDRIIYVTLNSGKKLPNAPRSHTTTRLKEAAGNGNEDWDGITAPFPTMPYGQRRSRIT